MGTWYGNKYVSVGDTLYFSKFGTTITSGYASKSGTFGTCYGKVTSLYDASYAFPVVIGGTVTAGTGGSFTTCTVKPADCSKGYQCYVVYNKNGGSSGTASQTGYVGASLTGTASRSGYQFAGWYTAASGGSKVTTIPASVNGATYYAHWTGNTYYVKFNGNGNTGGSTAQETFTYGASKALTANGFTRTGHTFSKWNTNSSGTGTNYSNKATVSNLTTTNKGTVNLYAQWTANTFYVSFNGNGATSGSMSKETFTYGVYKNLTSNAFSKGAAYKFTGWNTKADGSGTSYSNGQSVRNLTATAGGTVTLYAQWKLQYIAPTISSVKALRYSWDSDTQTYIEDDSGDRIHVEFDWSVDTVVPTAAGATNYLGSIVIKYKETSESSYTLAYTYTPSGNVSSGHYTYNSDNTHTISIEETYDIRIELTDTYGHTVSIASPQATVSTFISKAFFTMDFATGGHGIGIGMPSPTNGLDIGLKTTFYNNVYTSTVRPYNGVDGTWLRVSTTDAPDGDTAVLLGVSANTTNRGVYLSTKGSDSGHWLIREYWASGNPRIEIGDGSNTDGVWLMGHNSAIGSMISSDGTATLANTTSLTKIASLGTIPLGSWVIFAMVQFESNATGTRAARFYVNGTGSGVGYAAQPAGSGTRALNISSPYRVTSSSGSTIDLYARQNSGASMSVTWYYRAIRIA